ncbi:hypothetical protein BaRGS_00032358, partial [Batillaria attramentaria]
MPRDVNLYDLQGNSVLNRLEACGFLLKKNWNSANLYVHTCTIYSQRSVQYLCEMDEEGKKNSTGERGRTDLILPLPSDSVLKNFTTVTCGAGHVTYEFLSWDFRSACKGIDSYPAVRVASAW